MKTLILMRHSYAVSDNPAWSDFDRPLTEHGRQLARNTALQLAVNPPECIIHSAAARTTETANVIAENCAPPVECVSLNTLYLAPAAAYREAAASHGRPDQNVLMVVGHNPGIASLIQSWCPESLAIHPASLAIFNLRINDWQELGQMKHSLVSMSGFVSEGRRIR